MIEYLYSWNDAAPEGYRQTIQDGKVVTCINFPIEEAKRLYYATRSKKMQAYDSGLEAAAEVELMNTIKKAMNLNQ